MSRQGGQGGVGVWGVSASQEWVGREGSLGGGAGKSGWVGGIPWWMYKNQSVATRIRSIHMEVAMRPKVVSRIYKM